MSFNATVYRVLVASPGDLSEERGIIEGVIHHWNVSHGPSERIVLLPVLWETHAVPEYGDRPQAILNRRMVAECDLLIGAFWTRVGTPTGGYDSGTVEEIEQFTRAGKPALLYFSSRQIDPGQVDLDQLKRVRELRSRLEQVALISQFSSPAELESRLTRHLLEHVRRLSSDSSAAGAANGARPAEPPRGAPPSPVPAGPLDARALGMLYIDYWEAFTDALRHSHLRVRPPTASTRNYVRLSLRSSGMRLNAFTSVRDRLIGVELVLKHPECDEMYAGLKTARAQIEEALGQPLEWNELPGSFRIVLAERGYDPVNRADWPRQHAWLIDKLKGLQQHLLKPIGV